MRITSGTIARKLVLSCLALIWTVGGRVEAQQPAPFPPGYSSGPTEPSGPVRTATGLETLEDAWQIALNADRRLEASQWNSSAAASSLAAARAERLPSVNLGADYIALSQEPAFNLPASPILPSQLPFFEQESGGARAIVTQPLYTSGRITSGIRAAEAGTAASQADFRRTRLDVKMNVAEYYVAVLRATRQVEITENKAVSLAAHASDVQSMLDKGLRAKTDLLSAQVALADARQRVFGARNVLEAARASYNRMLGRPLTEPVLLAELPEEKAVDDVRTTHPAGHPMSAGNRSTFCPSMRAPRASGRH